MTPVFKNSYLKIQYPFGQIEIAKLSTLKEYSEHIGIE